MLQGFCGSVFCDVNGPEQVQGNLDTFRFYRMPFGIVCSPLLSEGTISFHLRNVGTPAAKKIPDNIHVLYTM